MKQLITIIGRGRIGSAIGTLLAHNGHSVVYWDQVVARRTKGTNLENSIIQSRAVFLCVPSRALQATIRNTIRHCVSTTILLCLTKGLTLDGKTPDELLRAARQPYGIVAGPLMAEELRTQGGVIALGTTSPRVRSMTQSLFADTNISIEQTTDTRGASWCGILKNVYALGFGMIDRIWGWNRKGWYIASASDEIAQLTHLFGGAKQTAYSIAGLGDLIATSFSKHSSNVRAGRLIAAKRSCNPAEGINSLPHLMRRLGTRARRFPLLNTIASMVRKA